MLRRHMLTAIVLLTLIPGCSVSRRSNGPPRPAATVRFQFDPATTLHAVAGSDVTSAHERVARLDGRVIAVHGDTIRVAVYRFWYSDGRSAGGETLGRTDVVLQPGTTIETREISTGRTTLIVGVLLLGLMSHGLANSKSP